MKVCFKCNQEKPFTEFYKHKQMSDGYLGKCKDCAKADVKARYHSGAGGKISEYERKRAKLPHRVESRKEYAQTESGKMAFARARKKYISANPDKKAAHTLLRSAILKGTVIKPSCCEMCGSMGRIHGHHSDYTKPLDVDWLCPLCHAKVHKEMEG